MDMALKECQALVKGTIRVCLLIANSIQIFRGLQIQSMATGVVQSDSAGNLTSSPALANGTTATTQPPGTNSTLLANTAFVWSMITPITIQGNGLIDLSATTNQTTFVLVNTTVGPATVIFPLANTFRIFHVIDQTGDASINNITIQGAGGDTINGSPVAIINTDRNALSFTNDQATSWYIF